LIVTKKQYLYTFLLIFVAIMLGSVSFAQKPTITIGDSLKISGFLKSATLFINRPGEVKADLDLAEKNARLALKSSETINYQKGVGESLLALSKVYKDRKNIKMGLAYLNRSIKIFSADFSNKEVQADADIEMASYYGINEASDLEKKIALYEHATGLLVTVIPNSMKLAEALKYLGDLYNIKEDNNSSIDRLKKALVIYKALNYDKLEDIYCLLGSVLNRTGASREGLKYLQLAEKNALKYRDSSSTVATMYNRMGIIYNSLNERPEANNAFEKGMIYAKRNRDKDAILIISANLGWSYIRINEASNAIKTLKDGLRISTPNDTAHNINLTTTLMEAYMHKHDIGNAFKCDAAIKNLVKQFYLYDFLLMNYHRAAARLYLMNRNFTKSQVQLDAMKAISQKSNNIHDMAGVEDIQYQLDSASNRPWDALRHLNHFKQLIDSLNRRNHDSELGQLQIEYKTEKKDLDIASLKQRALLQERTLNSEKLVRNLSIAGMLLFLLFTVVIGGSYRLKQKTNRELQNKQNAINGQNLSLKHLLKEREWLIKEVHHRVKNNLQIVISLLDSQSSSLLDEDALGVLRESRHRMHSISLVHQKLYQDENLTGINIKDYISELIGFLKDSFGTGKRIRFEYDVDPLLFDVSQVVPLALILNEAITNSIKYAFANQSECVISIRVKETTEDNVEISIADNGCGLPLDFDIDSCTTLGMNLISGLTKQLQGNLSVFTTDGLLICIKIQRLKMLGSTSKEVSLMNIL
jgi:two-component sensor histidine kinase